MKGKIEIDVEKLLQSGLDFLDYAILYLTFIKDFDTREILTKHFDYPVSDLQRLQTEGWIMYSRQEVGGNEELMLEEPEVEKEYYSIISIELRQRATDLFTSTTMIETVESVDSWADDFRKFYKSLSGPYAKVGIMGDSHAVKEGLKRFMKFHPQYTKEHIYAAASKYAKSEASSQYRYMMFCDYFISKTDSGKGRVAKSKLLAILEEGDLTPENQTSGINFDQTKLG